MKRNTQNPWSLINLLCKKLPVIALSLQAFCLLIIATFDHFVALYIPL